MTSRTTLGGGAMAYSWGIGRLDRSEGEGEKGGRMRDWASSVYADPTSKHEGLSNRPISISILRAPAHKLMHDINFTKGLDTKRVQIVPNWNVLT